MAKMEFESQKKREKKKRKTVRKTLVEGTDLKKKNDANGFRSSGWIIIHEDYSTNRGIF